MGCTVDGKIVYVEDDANGLNNGSSCPMGALRPDMGCR
jgi:hypothetical protein